MIIETTETFNFVNAEYPYCIGFDPGIKGYPFVQAFRFNRLVCSSNLHILDNDYRIRVDWLQTHIGENACVSENKGWEEVYTINENNPWICCFATLAFRSKDDLLLYKLRWY